MSHCCSGLMQLGEEGGRLVGLSQRRGQVSHSQTTATFHRLSQPCRYCLNVTTFDDLGKCLPFSVPRTGGPHMCVCGGGGGSIHFRSYQAEGQDILKVHIWHL